MGYCVTLIRTELKPSRKVPDNVNDIVQDFDVEKIEDNYHISFRFDKWGWTTTEDDIKYLSRFFRGFLHFVGEDGQHFRWYLKGNGAAKEVRPTMTWINPYEN